MNANSSEFENGCHLKQAKDTKTGVSSTADLVSMFVKKCWSRRMSRENTAGLACGHEQVKRVESVDAAPTPRHSRVPEIEHRRECASGRLTCTLCAQMGETENVFTTGVLHRSQTKACQASSVECSDRK